MGVMITRKQKASVVILRQTAKGQRSKAKGHEHGFGRAAMKRGIVAPRLKITN